MKLRIVSAIALVVAVVAFGRLNFAASSDSGGAQLFQAQHCVMCHGPDGKGYPAIHTPDFTSPKWQASNTDQQITETITNGKKGTSMPAFGKKLTENQIKELVHYIRSLNSKKKE